MPLQETIATELTMSARDTQRSVIYRTLRHLTMDGVGAGDSGGVGSGLSKQPDLDDVKSYLGHKLEVRCELMMLTDAGDVTIEASGHAETHAIKKLAYALVSWKVHFKLITSNLQWVHI